VLLALGGSTNAVIHLIAIAGRAGVKVSLAHLNTLSDSTPVLVNLKPVGTWRTFAQPAAWGRCCASSNRCCTSIA
jgi:dihydroxyacid dehydratase/phosphogluconate dehydratase